MQERFRYLIFLPFFWVAILFASEGQPISIAIYPNIDDTLCRNAKVRDAFPATFLLSRLDYSCDVIMQQAEFAYLVDLKVGTIVTHESLNKALFYLIKKHLFESIELILQPDQEGGGYSLQFKLQAFWTFKKLTFKGIFLGKDRFRQLYSFEYGDRFDEQRHEDALKKMLQALYKEGYLGAELKAYLIKDNNTKSITVQIDLRKGSRFFVRGVSVNVRSQRLTPYELQELKELVQERFSAHLEKNYYARDHLDAETKELKRLLAERGYLLVEPTFEEHILYETREVSLSFDLYVSYKKRFIFEGNHFFSQQELLQAILLFGRSTSLLPASILSEELVKLYRKKGFWSVVVDVQEEPDAYRFVIEEGPRAYIKQVHVRNLESFDAHRIQKKFFNYTLCKRYYDVVEVQSACEKLLEHLLYQGFWQAELLREYAEPLKEGGYKLILMFDEGKRCFLKDVEVDILSKDSLGGPFKDLLVPSHKVPFNIELIDRQREWLTQKFYKLGYYRPSIKPEYNNNHGDISVHWKVDVKDTDICFDKTVLRGSNTFPFSFIQRELDYRVGDKWHPDALRNSVSRLKKMEVFDSVVLVPDDDEQMLEKVMLLSLQKDEPFEVKMRLGLGAQHVTKTLTTGGPTYRVGGSFIYKNPLNVGDQFRIDADFTRAIRSVNGLYRRPWIFGLPITAEIRGYSNRFEYPGFIGSQKNLYTVVQQGFLANFAGVYSHVDASLNTGFEIVDTFIDESTVDDIVFADKVAKAINFRPDLLDKNIPFFQMQPTVMLYFLDNTVNPTRGSFSVFSAKGMFPVAKLSLGNFFIRLLAEQSFFLPVMPFVLAFRLRVGHIFHPQFSTIIPIERFYLGGANSIRSYETDQCPPLGIVTDINGENLYVPQGGRSLVNFNAEVRFPLYDRLGGVVFGDIGALSTNKLTELRACDLLSGIGFGLRYQTPIGPLRFDFAWRGHKRDGVGRPYAWFLSFGNAFI